MSKTEAMIVQIMLNERYGRKLTAFGAKHKLLGKSVSVYMELGAGGKVTRYSLQISADQRKRFGKELGAIIAAWGFPSMKRPGSCTVKLTFTRPNIDIHMHEMAPRHMLERVPAPQRAIRRG